MINFHIITIFPKVFTEYFNTSIIKRAQQKKLVKINIHNLRDFTTDKHKTVDDKPYGGGPGMIFKADIIYRALSKIKNKQKIILLSPAGKQFDQKMAQKFSKLKEIVFICGRYEGVDARVEKFVDEKISVGPYVLSGGELPAMTIVEAITRLIPGVIKPESLQEESFSISNSSKLVISGVKKSDSEYPQYTRPEVLTIREKNAKIKVLKVPKVLLSGNHQEIRKWRNK
jgi:tRNA (guanine37-N1)-methyltransferase